MAPLLLALGASVVLLSAARGERVVGLDRFFLGEGRKNNVVEPDEILTEVRIPAPVEGSFSAYQKLRPRAAIDFPILSVALVGRRHKDGTLASARVVVGALGAKPREVSGVTALVEGRQATPEIIETVSQAALKQCRPLTNIPIDPDWRHALVPVLVRRAFGEALGMPVGPPGLVPVPA